MAIAFDAAVAPTGQASGLTFTFSHTVAAGSNLILFVGAIGGSNTSGNVMSGVTYNGVAMTQVAFIDADVTGDRWLYLFYLVNPATGANNVVITWSNSTYFNGGCAASYSGAKQTGVPDASDTDEQASGGDVTCSLTTIADNCWGVMVCKGNQVSASTGSTMRAEEATNDRYGVYDTNGPKTPAGALSMAVNSVTFGGNGVMASFAPAVAAGPANLKTWNGLAKASVKTMNGLAIGSVKTRNGLA